MPRGKPLPVMRKLNIYPCRVKWGNGVSCSMLVHPHNQVIVADVVKECCCVAFGHDNFVDLFIWCQSHHIIAYAVPEHVDVPHVLILLLGWQLEKIFACQDFFLCSVFPIVAKLALAVVISSKVWIAFARFMVKNIRPVMALVAFLERLPW